MICLDLDFNLTKKKTLKNTHNKSFFSMGFKYLVPKFYFFKNTVKALRDVCRIVDGFKAYILKRNET